MPIRKTPLVTGEIYHVMNRGVAKMPIFLNKKDYIRFMESFIYYQHSAKLPRYSYFVRLPNQEKMKFMQKLNLSRIQHVEIISFCLMPNHMHILIKQIEDEGLMKFMRNISNSYTRYFNEKYKRIGPLLQGRFKNVHIATTEQLLHVDRYIHLNPYSSKIINSQQEIYSYLYSSLNENFARFCNRGIIDEHFKRNTYREFLLDQADYQRELDQIKHLVLED